MFDWYRNEILISVQLNTGFAIFGNLYCLLLSVCASHWDISNAVHNSHLRFCFCLNRFIYDLIYPWLTNPPGLSGFVPPLFNQILFSKRKKITILNANWLANIGRRRKERWNEREELAAMEIYSSELKTNYLGKKKRLSQPFIHSFSHSFDWPAWILKFTWRNNI